MRKTIVFTVLTLGAGLIGCGSSDGPTATPDAGGGTVIPGTDAGGTTDPVDSGNGGSLDPRVSACRDAIEAREALVGDQLAGWSIQDSNEMVPPAGGSQARDADYAGHYRDDLLNHPGCMRATEYGANTTEPFINDNEAPVPSGAPLDINGYPCAAKLYDQPAEDVTKPIVILVHGNSSGPTSFEEYHLSSIAGTEIATSSGFTFTADSTTRPQLATRLLDAGYQVIGFDARVGMVATLEDWNADVNTGNAFLNIDHGWAVPIMQSLIRAVMENNPTRQVSLVGHSLGTTVIRDALRRLYVAWTESPATEPNPFAQLKDVVLLSGANHGVVAGQFACDTFQNSMRGTVTCEMGDRDAFVPTRFTRAINGPADLFATPCADGDYAFGQRDQCEGNVVDYTTITMRDIAEGQLQDEFVSEDSAALDLEPCVDNELVELTDFDSSGYFFTGANGFFASHFGAARSDAGIQLILNKLAD